MKIDDYDMDEGSVIALGLIGTFALMVGIEVGWPILVIPVMFWLAYKLCPD